MENEKIKETQSQTIKSILELVEAFNVPEKAVSIIRKKCWYLADSQPQGNGNGKTRLH